ncbi:MAG: hypothetical protein A2086_00720 [Spirochaetes bacterium GWD1_27_9]|nr:MAG: hypothetical protein A2Y34_01915 [Spirochaetes bacterium GWC1_27_15]OHD32533.1 MAG: hypothetical protein A2086_00720 [Spirochaetes bacterium GWD1_27_9]
MLHEHFKCCLYFSAARLSRVITKMAENSFATIGLSPTYAFLLMVVKDKEKTTPKELSEILHIAASTITRFLDKLESKNLIKRNIEGKNCFVTLTEQGNNIQIDIEKAWKKLYDDYCVVLGNEEAEKITEIFHETSQKLEKSLVK